MRNLTEARMLGCVIAAALAFMAASFAPLAAAESQPADGTLTIGILRIVQIDEIDPVPGADYIPYPSELVDNQADWYYYVGIKEDGKDWVWQKSDPNANADDWSPNSSYEFQVSSDNVSIAITLCERDREDMDFYEYGGTDELADISAENGGGINGAGGEGADVAPGPYDGASYVGTYHLGTGELSGDKAIIDSSGSNAYKTSGEGDNDSSNDAYVIFSIADDYEPPAEEIREEEQQEPASGEPADVSGENAPEQNSTPGYEAAALAAALGAVAACSKIKTAGKKRR